VKEMLPGWGGAPPPLPGSISFTVQVHTTYETEAANRKDDNQPLLCMIFNKNMYKLCIFMCFSTIFTALFYPYIAHEQTTQNLKLSFRLLLFLLLSAIAPNIKVRSRAREISKSDVPSSAKKHGDGRYLYSKMRCLSSQPTAK